MDDQKIENMLNLALDTPPKEREKSESLAVGYDAADNTWQVIVRYSGDLASAAEETAPGRWQIQALSGGYAIVTLPQEDMELLAALPQIEYIEKPKRLFFTVDRGRAASCLSAVQTGPSGLDGSGVLIGLADSGIDYFHPDFRNEDGTTRIIALWDQSAPESLPFPGGGPGRPPEGFLQGREYTKAEIDAALAAGSREAGLNLVPVQDPSGHGTEVLGIAAGNGRSSGGQYRGVAPGSDLIVVKLGVPRPGGFPRTTELMTAVEYLVRKAEELRLPIAVNMSFGNVYGSHRGTSLLETYLDQMANRWKSVFVAGMGNEGSADGHVSGRVGVGGQEVIELTIGENEPSLNIQLWKNYADEYRVTVIHPGGQAAGPFGWETGAAQYRLGSTTLLVYNGDPAPYQAQQEIFFEFIPEGSGGNAGSSLSLDGSQRFDDGGRRAIVNGGSFEGETYSYLDSGVWRIVLTPVRIVTGDYSMWMTDSRARNRDTRFLRPTPDATVTIPATAPRIIAVGAYDALTGSYAPFSGRGWSGETYGVRPDLVAPGVSITTSANGGGYTTVTGTSFAAPFVTGSAALLMQFGIVRGNDPFLYGEKVRAYLRRGARALPGFMEYPNNQVGYGALCVRDSLPI